MDSAVLIPNLDDDERALLREIADSVRRRPARTMVARKAFERVARQLEGAAQS